MKERERVNMGTIMEIRKLCVPIVADRASDPVIASLKPQASPTVHFF